jgi:hypothetical protein
MAIELPWAAKHKSLEELQSEDETASVELSIAQKRAAIAKLKANGLTPKSFGNSWANIRAWLKSH